MTRRQQIAAELQNRIVAGSIETGATLPSERQLAQEFGAARRTVRAALEALAERGVVEPVAGVGWIVQATLHVQEFVSIPTFSQWARSRGLVAGGLVLRADWDTVSRTDARVLRTATDAQVLRVLRVRMIGGRRVMLERATYADWVAPVIAALPPDEPSHMYAMAAAGIHPAFGRHQVDVTSASSEDSRVLGVRRGSPLLRIHRVTYTADRRGIEHGEDRYIPGTIVLEVQGPAKAE